MSKFLNFNLADEPVTPAGGGYRQLDRWLVLLVVGLTIVRLLVAAYTPLAFDEALYWSYSKHLAAGYMDHPFLNPLLIRLGCSLFGDTPLGVRFFAVLLSLPASWAVWAAARCLFADRRLAAMAALLFNLTVVMSVGAIAATSDQVVVATSSLLLLALAKVHATGRGSWWLGVGAAFGLGMCAKYTTLFFAVGILVWLVSVPEQRWWLRSPWPWLGGLVAVAVFSPVLLWNAHHGWASIVYQSGRLASHHWTLKYEAELLGALIGLATPSVFVLGLIGLFSRGEKDASTRSARMLIAGQVAPLLAYFAWHALHERVQGNWIEPIYPAAAVAAAYAVRRFGEQAGARGGWVRWSWRLSAPIGLALAGFAYLAAATPLIPLSGHDPRVRMFAIGWPDVGRQLDEVRLRTGAKVILTTDYTMTGWARFYLPSNSPVVQINQRMRWSNEPPPEPAMLTGPALYLCRKDCSQLSDLRARYGSVTRVATLTRRNGSKVLSLYPVYQLTGQVAPVLDSETLIPRAGAQ